jgi:hypothetical protein
MMMLIAVTTTILVQDDHQCTFLGVNNLCRPGTLAPCLGESRSSLGLTIETLAGKIDPSNSEWYISFSSYIQGETDGSGRLGGLKAPKRGVSVLDTLSALHNSCVKVFPVTRQRGEFDSCRYEHSLMIVTSFADPLISKLY